MNHDKLQDELDNTREQLLILLDALPDEALVAPGTLGAWSVRDLLVHLAIWEAELVTGLMKIQQNKKPDHLLKAIGNRHNYNQTTIGENQGRELDRVFDDLQGSRYHLEQWIEEFSHHDLTHNKKYNWLRGKPLWQFIAENSYLHEAEHLPALEQLVADYEEPRIGFADIEII
jgi:hypothetical protein